MATFQETSVPDDHWDVLIIGGEPGGASAAHKVAATGKRIHKDDMEAHHRLKRKLEHVLGATDCYPVLLDRSLHLGKNIPVGGAALRVADLVAARLSNRQSQTAAA
ncbi:MAG: hypothetical protein ACREEB_10185 [Caulobacteraceae bacterium]